MPRVDCQRLSGKRNWRAPCLITDGMALVTVDSAERVISCAIKVHSATGPGLFESVYELCLTHELGKAGIKFRRQALVPLIYDSVVIAQAFRADFIVEEELIVEVKSVEQLSPLHQKQLLTYLRLSRLRKGLLINFNAPRLKDGLKSVVA
jgi:GxxExxY protein